VKRSSDDESIGLFRVRRSEFACISVPAKRSSYDHALSIHEEVVASAFPSWSHRFGLCVYLVGADIEASVLGLQAAG
jgi:hypothetical protein